MTICLMCSDQFPCADPGIELITICARCERAHFPMNIGEVVPASERLMASCVIQGVN